MIAKLLKTALAFAVGFGLGLLAVLLNGEFIIHIPLLLGILAAALYLTREKWWAFWV
ncbi:hypothetical protein [Denitrobaculum tricleocarpae]|uniref:hypothetical protein n=1 Tax=Denitrobaculum tricleocarpae TaxID=2591009 RepID=UPI0015D40446|nr:hypothetical protein [Denitrobaculum tricleocarpae]